jgi:hypothetical protein
MIGRLALRSLTAHPLRSAILAAGFGVGVAVMAILLGVAQIVLEQAQSPALVGGGDVVIRLSPQVPARLLLSGTLQSDALRGRLRAAAPTHTTELFLFKGGLEDTPGAPVAASQPERRRDEPPRRDPATPGGGLEPGAAPGVQVVARGGIPSLERALGDKETSGIEAWRDSPADVAWTLATPDSVLRHIDRFHAIPDAPDWASSWAEWLYFNGRAGEARFYLTFLVGPRTPDGARSAGVRLQLERDGRVETYSAAAPVTDAEVQRAPDLTIGGSFVRLEGMQYRIHLDLADAAGRAATGDLTLQASAGRLVPPLEISGARGWRTGYVVPVMSGSLDGAIRLGDEVVSFRRGTGYHDHNWGFWQDVSWQWGQVQHEELSFLYGRVFPPPDAADPERIPGFVGALGPDGPLGYATDVSITETNDPQGRPRTISVRARGTALDLTIRFDVASAVTTRMTQGPLANGADFLQLRGQYTVTGRAGHRDINFSAPGAAETFRGARTEPR